MRSLQLLKLSMDEILVSFRLKELQPYSSSISFPCICSDQNASDSLTRSVYPRSDGDTALPTIPCQESSEQRLHKRVAFTAL